MSDLTPQQRLEAEQAIIAGLTDTTEQALAQAALRLKIAAMKGEKGASAELTKANKALNDYRQNGGRKTGEQEERFKNRAAALAWLQSRGQISHGKFIADCAAGYPTVHADKTLSKWQVMEYAEKLFGGVRETPVAVDLSAKKARLEIEKLEQEVEKGKLANRKEDDKWLYKDEAWAQMAAVIVRLRDSLRHQFHVGSIALVTSVGGDHQRAPELYETAEALISRAFNELVEKGRISGIFEKHPEDSL